jgi:hypothetical protein
MVISDEEMEEILDGLLESIQNSMNDFFDIKSKTTVTKVDKKSGTITVEIKLLDRTV